MSHENTQFKPGVSGNPNGRPRGSFSLKTRVIQYLENNPDELGNIVKSLASDPQHRELLFKMIDGTPKQQTEYSGIDGSPMNANINVTFKDGSPIPSDSQQ